MSTSRDGNKIDFGIAANPNSYICEKTRAAMSKLNGELWVFINVFGLRSLSRRPINNGNSQPTCYIHMRK